jgi:hypothetical protein
MSANWTSEGKYVFQGKDCIGIFDTDNASDKVMAQRAKLASAAPEMLELLQEVLEWNEDDADLATNGTAFRLKNFADTVSNRSAALRAAIARAKGEA